MWKPGTSFHQRYMKGIPFLSKMVYEEDKGLDLGAEPPRIKSSWVPPLPPGVFLETICKGGSESFSLLKGAAVAPAIFLIYNHCNNERRLGTSQTSTVLAFMSSPLCAQPGSNAKPEKRCQRLLERLFCNITCVTNLLLKEQGNSPPPLPLWWESIAETWFTRGVCCSKKLMAFLRRKKKVVLLILLVAVGGGGNGYFDVPVCRLNNHFCLFSVTLGPFSGISFSEW